jgi:hypothetical protein
MSGYLRRLASSVLHGERAIHPDVGSVWSAARHDREPFESPGAMLVPSRHEDTLIPARMQPDRDTTARGTAPYPGAKEPPDAELSDAKLNVAATFTPLVPLAQREDFSAPRTPDPALHNEAFTSGDPAAPPATTISQTPLRGESSRLPVLSTRMAPPQTVAGGEPAPLALRSQPAQPPASEPDTIEIHIGRIEVLATPPPAPRPAARPARKSPDLAEYLRRDRRTR